MKKKKLWDDVYPCSKCKKPFDYWGFMVKLEDGRTYRSMVCRKCAKEDKTIEIIKTPEKARGV